jgi:hypothetical protein
MTSAASFSSSRLRVGMRLFSIVQSLPSIQAQYRGDLVDLWLARWDIAVAKITKVLNELIDMYRRSHPFGYICRVGRDKIRHLATESSHFNRAIIRKGAQETVHEFRGIVPGAQVLYMTCQDKETCHCSKVTFVPVLERERLVERLVTGPCFECSARSNILVDTLVASAMMQTLTIHLHQRHLHHERTEVLSLIVSATRLSSRGQHYLVLRRS